MGRAVYPARKKRVLMAGACLLLFFAVIVFSAQYTCSVTCNASPHDHRPDVGFLDQYHDMHIDLVDCMNCHHDYENGENVLTLDALEYGEAETRCRTCHTPESKINGSEAFHGQCIPCHDRMRAKDKNVKASLCGECHAQKETS